MLKSTTLRSFAKLSDVTGPTQLLIIWAVSILIGWAAAGRHFALISWILIGGVVLLCMGLAFWFTANLKLRRLRSAHRRFEQQGRKDAHRLAWIAGMRFRAHHFVLAAAFVCVGGGAALSMKGLAVSGGFLVLAILPCLILVVHVSSLNRSVVSGAALFLKPQVRRTETGSDAIEVMRHSNYVKSALTTAHIGTADGVAAREFLATVRHEDAFWPDISQTLSLDFNVEMKWRIFALCGVIWHALAAALLVILLALFSPFSILSPLASPLDLLPLPVPEDEQQQADEESAEDGPEQGEGADGGDGDEQGEGADSGDGDEQGEGADGSDGGEQGEGADGSDGGEQGEGADGSDGGEQGEGADGSDGDEQGEGADGSDGGEQGEGADGSDGDEQGEGADGSDGDEQGEGADSGDGDEQGEGADGSDGGAQGEGADGSDGGEQGEGADGSDGGAQGADDGAQGADGSDGRAQDEMSESIEAQVTIQSGEEGTDGGEQDINIAGQGTETDGQDGVVLEDRGETADGDPESVTSSTLTGSAAGETARTDGVSFDTNPFSARGLAPENVEVLQTDIPEFPENLPPADPPTQRVPAWILQLESAID